MNESIHKYFNMGTIQWMSYPGVPMADALTRIARDDFFDTVELCGVPADELETCRSILAQSHMTPCCCCHPLLLSKGLNPNAEEESARKAAEAALIAAVDEAAYFGSPTMTFLAGKWTDRQRALPQLIKTTLAVCAYGRGKGVSVNLEVFDYDVDKSALIGPAPLATEYAATIRREFSDFGLIADLSHFPISHETSRSAIGVMRPYITGLHIGNAVAVPGREGYGDQHPRFGFPGGANDVAELTEFFRVLRGEGLFRPEEPLNMSIEVKPRAGEDADIILAATKRVIRRAWLAL